MTLSRRIPLLAALLAATLTAAAPAQQEAFMTLKGQKQGMIAGDAAQATHRNEMELLAFSAAPSGSGVAQTAFTVTMSIYALPQILSAEVTNEPVTPRFTFYHHDKFGHETLDYTVTAALATITKVVFNSNAGSPSLMDVTITTISAPAIASAPAVATTTAFPTLAGPAGAMKNAEFAIRADMLKGRKSGTFDPHTPGPMQGIVLTSVQFEVSAQAGGTGKPLFSKVAFTKMPDRESTPLMAAATSGEDVSGSVLKWYAPSPTGAPKLVLMMGILGGAFVVPAPGTGMGAEAGSNSAPAGRVVNGVEEYLVTLKPAMEGELVIKLTRPSPVSIVQY